MNHPVENANPRRRRTTLASPLVAALTLLLVLLGAQSATAQDQSATSQASQPAISTQPLATASTTPTPSPTPTPSEAEKTDHQQQNGEEDVERTDLSLLGFAFVGAIGFLLAAGALGVFLSARAKRSRDHRSTTHSEEASDEA